MSKRQPTEAGEVHYAKGDLYRIHHLQKLFKAWGDSDTHYSVLTLSIASDDDEWQIELEAQCPGGGYFCHTGSLSSAIENAITWLEERS